MKFGSVGYALMEFIRQVVRFYLRSLVNRAGVSGRNMDPRVYGAF